MPENKTPEKTSAPKQVFLPTPEIGQTVQWFPKADVTNGARSAIVTSIEAPGRVSITIWAKNGEVIFLEGVRHLSDDIHTKNPHNQTTENYGGWDFIPKKDPYEFAMKEADRREQMLEAERQQRERAAKKRAEEAKV